MRFERSALVARLALATAVASGVLLVPSAARAGISYVNDHTVAANNNNQSAVTGTLTGVTAGNFLVAIVTTDMNATITKPSGWIDPGLRADSGANVGVAIYYYPSYPSSGTVSATFSFSAADGAGIVQLVELSGVATSNPLDVTGSASGQGTSAAVTASAATTSSDDLALIGWANSTGNRTFGNPQSPWALVNNDVQSQSTDEEGTYQAGIDFGTTVSETLSVQRSTTYWAVVLVTLKAAPLYWIGKAGSATCPSGSSFTSTSCWSKASGGSSAGVAPGANDLVTFDGNGTGDCALGSTAATQLTSLTMTSAYTGTVTQGAKGLSLSGDLSVAGGTLKGASGQTLAVSGTLTVNGGTVDGNGGTLNPGALSVASGVFTGDGATVTAGSLSVSGGTYAQGAGAFTATGDAVFSGGAATFGSGPSAFKGALTTSGAGTSLTFGSGAPTVTGAATFGGGAVTFGSGALTLNGGLDVEGATVTLGASSSTANVNGTCTVGAGALSLTNGAAATDFTCTGLFTQSGGTVTVNGATAAIGSTITTSQNDAFAQSGGTFDNSTAGGAVSFGSSGGGGGVMDQTGAGAVYASASTSRETLNGPLKVSGSTTLGNAALAGSTASRQAVTVNGGGTLTLSSAGFAFTSTSNMTMAGTLSANGPVTFTPNVTISGTYNANASSSTFNGAVTLSGTYNANTSTTNLASTTSLSGTFNANSSSSVTFGDTVTMSTGSAFNGGAGTTTFAVAPTLTAGTFTVASAGSTGRVIFTAGATFASGMTLAFPTSGGTLSAPGGQAIAVNGTVTSSAGSASTPPKIARSTGTTGVTISFGATSVLDVDGLELDNSVAGGVAIANGATYTTLKHLTFKNNVAASTSTGATHLAITSANTGGTKVITVPGCYFDATAQYNVTLSGVNGSTGVRAIFEYRSATQNGPRAGPAYDLDADTDGDNVANSTTASRYGAVVEWVNAVPTDTAGTAVGFPTAAFDWNTFAYYGVYVAYKDTSGAGSADLLWMRNSDGSAAYSFSVPQTSGDLIGTPFWDSRNEVTANLDINGDGDKTDTDVRIVYLATTGGHIIKLVDDGSSLARPASGAWAADFTSSAVTSITSPLASDGTNLYFGGASATTPNVYGVQIASGSNEAKLVKTVATVKTITAAPSWASSGGATYVFLGSAATSSQAYIYRVNMTSGSVDASYSGATTSLNGGVVVANSRAYVVSDAGKIYAISAFGVGSGGFTNVTGFPYQTTAAAAIKFAPWVDASDTTAYFGDDSGKLYYLNAAGALQTALGYPVSVTAGKITSTPLYRHGGGVIALGASDGYVYFIDRSTGTVFKRFFVTGAGTISSVAYNGNISAYMVSSSDGKLAFVNGADVTDPTSATP